MTATQQTTAVSKHGQVPGGAFIDEYVCNNMENYLESKGSLEGMFVLKAKKETRNGTVFIPMKYVPAPDGDKREYDLLVYSRDIYVHGKIYNEEKKYAPELKHAKYTLSGFEKHDKDEKGYYTSLREGETIEKEDINYNYRIREMLNKYLTDKIEEYQNTEKWGNPKDRKGKKKSFDVIVTNFDLKDGLNTKTPEFEDRVVPYVTFKFSEDEGVISTDQKGRPDYKLKILDNRNQTLEITRDNINQEIPSKTKIRMVVSHRDIKISKFGISLTRYINNFRIEELPKPSGEKFSFDDWTREDEPRPTDNLNFDD